MAMNVVWEQVLSISTQRKAKASSTVGCTVEEGIFLKKSEVVGGKFLMNPIQP